jgi:hypothetical protein
MMDAEDLRVCRHEALHCVTALHYGMKVASVSRETHKSGDGETLMVPTLDAFEVAVVLLMPLVDNPMGRGCHYDLTALDRFLRLGVKLSAVWETCQSLLEDGEFRRRVRKIETALYERPQLTGVEATLLAS